MKNNKKYLNIIWVVAALTGIVAFAAYIQYDRNALIQCDDFKDPIVWTTQDNSRNVTLHYEIKNAPRPADDKTIRVFWGDNRSTKQSIGLGSNLSGSIDHQYATSGDKRIEVFLSLTNSTTECGIYTFVSL